jgi:hypothetical protein
MPQPFAIARVGLPLGREFAGTPSGQMWHGIALCDRRRTKAAR